MFANTAQLIAFVAVAAFFATAGWATARDAMRPGTVPWLAGIAAVVISAYALIAYNWPWVAGSLGIFAVVHLVTSLGSIGRPAPTKTKA